MRMYILFAFLSLFGNGANTIFNKYGGKNCSPYIFSFLKAVFIIIFSVLFAWITGGINQMFSLTGEQILWLVLGCAGFAANYILYMIAIKKSNLYGFSPFVEITQLLFSNVFFLIFLTPTVVNVNSFASVALYLGGIILLLSAAVIIAFNKFLNENCNRKWILFAALATLCTAFQQLCVSYKLSNVNAGVISTYSGISLLIVGFVGAWIFGYLKELKTLGKKDYLFIFLSGLANTVVDISLFLAYASEGCNQAVVLTIFALNYIFVFTFSLIKERKKIRPVLWIITLLDLAGMILFVLAELFTH